MSQLPYSDQSQFIMLNQLSGTGQSGFGLNTKKILHELADLVVSSKMNFKDIASNSFYIPPDGSMSRH